MAFAGAFLASAGKIPVDSLRGLGIVRLQLDRLPRDPIFKMLPSCRFAALGDGLGLRFLDFLFGVSKVLQGFRFIAENIFWDLSSESEAFWGLRDVRRGRNAGSNGRRICLLVDRRPDVGPAKSPPQSAIGLWSFLNVEGKIVWVVERHGSRVLSQLAALGDEGFRHELLHVCLLDGDRFVLALHFRASRQAGQDFFGFAVADQQVRAASSHFLAQLQDALHPESSSQGIRLSA
mmetsp:Transcript_88170/g.184223  ORF Transcript_88170/g.184223 Transcript_88170/m.184223 type:complete len:234 (+) Transcript_88170:1076-1777(+)